MQDDELLEKVLKTVSPFVSSDNPRHVEILNPPRLLQMLTDAMRSTHSDDVRAVICLLVSNLCLEND